MNEVTAATTAVRPAGVQFGREAMSALLSLCSLGAVFALLLLPVEARDAGFVVAALLCVMVATIDFAASWTWFVLILPLGHLVGFMFGVPALTFVRLVLAGLLCVLAFGGGGVTLRRGLLRDRGFMAFVLFVGANVASGVHAGSAAAVARALTYAEPALFCLFTYCVVRRFPGSFKSVMRAMVIGGILVAALGLVEIATQQPVFVLFDIKIPGITEDFSHYLELNRFGLGGRILSTIGQPVYTALYFAIWLVVAVYYVLTYERRHSNAWLSVLVPAGILVMLATGTRAALLGFVPMLLTVVMVMRSRSRLALGLGAATVAIAVTLAAPTLVDYLRASVTLDERSTENANVLGRIDLTTRLLGYFGQSPVWGTGPGVIQQASLHGVDEFQGLGGVENQYTLVLADGGVVAGAAYLLFMAGSLRTLWSVTRSTDRRLKAAGLMALALFVFYFVAVLTVTCLIQIPNSLLMIVYGAVTARVHSLRLDAQPA